MIRMLLSPRVRDAPARLLRVAVLLAAMSHLGER